MEKSTIDSTIAYAVALLGHYGFELRGYTAQELVELWLGKYPANWVRLGVIEALYQGRYKAISVEQILAVWLRRGQPIYRFNHEFERLISRKLPQDLTVPLEVNPTSQVQEETLPPETSRPSQISNESVSSALDKEQESRTEQPLVSKESQSNSNKLTEEELRETALSLPEDLPLQQTELSLPPDYTDYDWSRCEVSKQPIDCFTPPPDSSGFYLKLKAVAEQQE